jgi:Domain of unknown function (DUF6883)
MKLPTDAQIAPEKLARYLLVKRPVGDKSEFLRQAAYTLDNPERLEEDIRRQILILDAVSVEKTNYGELFEIRGSLVGPNTRILTVKTVWMQEFRSGITKFITLYSDKGGTP